MCQRSRIAAVTGGGPAGEAMARRDMRPQATGPGAVTVRVGAVAALLALAVLTARVRAGSQLAAEVGPARDVLLDLARPVGLGVLAAGLVLLLRGARRPSAHLDGGPSDRTPRFSVRQRTRVVVAALIGLMVALTVQLLLAGLGPRPARRARPNEPPPAGPGVGPRPPDGAGVDGWQFGLARSLTVLAAVVVLAALVIVLWRRGGGPDSRAGSDSGAVAALVRAVAAGQAAVRDRASTDPRQAIIRCFAAMEDALAGLGESFAPRDADTPAEVLARAFAAELIPQRPARELLGLFREARFSAHPLGEPERDAADRALTTILAALPATRELVR